MKGSELRIGNFVINDDWGSEECTIDIHDLLAMSQYESNTQESPHLHPVPLTEEWLIKFGFGKSDEHERGHNLNPIFGFYFDWHFKRFYLEVQSERVRVDHLLYVHQLQNLYFALTGIELTIKP